MCYIVQWGGGGAQISIMKAHGETLLALRGGWVGVKIAEKSPS